ncbi:MAG: metalloregulator ArsR/SmtB family transcription factor [Verrucomicrobiota bacterium]|nr:metalloregulator ArsR/SmtB family transcription factor [Verrucomicrobiota bacterium]
MIEPWDLFKTLADPTRLRMLRLLRDEELSVAELQQILDMGQSRISTHLAILRQSVLVADRKEGKRTYYSLAKPLSRGVRPLLNAAFEAMADSPESARDDSELRRILEKRRELSERYFNEIAGRLGRNYCPGRSAEAVSQFFLQLTPSIDIADLGAGEGLLGHMLARRARTVYCVDNSPKMVEIGSSLAKQYGFANVHYKLGDIESVPLPDQSVDVAYLSQALHHALHPQKAIEEAYRILRPGGQVLILDLKEHHFEKARELYADRWLGFRESALHELLRDAGFEQVDVRLVARETMEPNFETLLACGKKAGVS